MCVGLGCRPTTAREGMVLVDCVGVGVGGCVLFENCIVDASIRSSPCVGLFCVLQFLMVFVSIVCSAPCGCGHSFVHCCDGYIRVPASCWGVGVGVVVSV